MMRDTFDYFNRTPEGRRRFVDYEDDSEEDRRLHSKAVANRTNHVIAPRHRGSFGAPETKIRVKDGRDTPVILTRSPRGPSRVHFPPGAPSGSATVSTDAQTVWNPSTTKDMTIHFEMDIADDIDGRLEEFSHLKRLGDFAAAEQYFHDILEPFADILPVAIEYADMLVEQGAYKDADRFITKAKSLVKKERMGPNPDKPLADAFSLYSTNLRLIGAFSSIRSGSRMKRGHRVVQGLESTMGALKQRRETGRHLDSAEIQAIRYSLKILSEVTEETDLISEKEVGLWSNWCHLYSPLLAEGRIWDARDILTASIEADGAVDVWKWTFNADIYAEDAFAKLFSDWNVTQYDESTYLAILDILVSLSTALTSVTLSTPVPDRKGLHAAERCLEHACKLAARLKENSPYLTKSRPYIRWVLAEEELQRKQNPGDYPDLRSHLGAYPGLTVWRGAVPIYIPIKAENPLWKPAMTDNKGLGAVETDEELLEIALGAAHELKDYATEALCLGELICRSTSAVETHLEHLRKLQHTVQGDILGFQQTTLSTFLFATGDHARQDMFRDLEEIYAREGAEFAYTLTNWCSTMIEQVLSSSLGIRLAGSHVPSKQKFSKYLPQHIKHHLVGEGLDRAYGLDLDLDRKKVREAASCRASDGSSTGDFSPSTLSESSSDEYYDMDQPHGVMVSSPLRPGLYPNNNQLTGRWGTECASQEREFGYKAPFSYDLEHRREVGIRDSYDTAQRSGGDADRVSPPPLRKTPTVEDAGIE